MEAITIQLPIEKEKHVTYYLGDVHEGAANQDEKALKKAVELIAANGDDWIGLGDFVDAINYKDKRFNPHEIQDKYSVRDLDDLPMCQSNHFLQMIRPIANKCIGMVYGNHEDTYRSAATFDVIKYMTDALKIKNFKHKGWVSFSFTGARRIPVKVVFCHGKGGGGMREGYPINRVYDTLRRDMADVKVMGHLHRMMVDEDYYNRYDNGALRQDPVWYGVNGCFLRKSTIGNDGYFEQSSGKESSIGLLKQTIVPGTASTKKDFKITLEMVLL